MTHLESLIFTPGIKDALVAIVPIHQLVVLKFDKSPYYTVRRDAESININLSTTRLWQLIFPALASMYTSFYDTLAPLRHGPIDSTFCLIIAALCFSGFAFQPRFKFDLYQQEFITSWGFLWPFTWTSYKDFSELTGIGIRADSQRPKAPSYIEIRKIKGKPQIVGIFHDRDKATAAANFLADATGLVLIANGLDSGEVEQTPISIRTPKIPVGIYRQF